MHISLTHNEQYDGYVCVNPSGLSSHTYGNLCIGKVNIMHQSWGSPSSDSPICFNLNWMVEYYSVLSLQTGKGDMKK